MIVAKVVNSLYPDIIAHGRLANTLQSALTAIGSSLKVSDFELPFQFVVFACVKSDSRMSQMYIGEEQRMFIFDFWARGVALGGAATSDISEAARAIDKWLTTECKMSEMASNFYFVTADQDAEVFERGEEVEARWQEYIDDIRVPALVPFVNAASEHPELRQLFPYTSMHRFCFSLCTGYPYSDGLPMVVPQSDGTFEVVDGSANMVGKGTVQEAAIMVVQNLPAGCGKAVPGTSDDL